jgi:hypothetical protein
MKTIWKFPLQVIDSQVVSMPRGAKPLTVQVQDGKPCLWAIVDPEAAKEDRVVEIHGTGHQTNKTLDRHYYIGTFQLEGGALVFHAFMY